MDLMKYTAIFSTKKGTYVTTYLENEILTLLYYRLDTSLRLLCGR